MYGKISHIFSKSTRYTTAKFKNFFILSTSWNLSVYLRLALLCRNHNSLIYSRMFLIFTRKVLLESWRWKYHYTVTIWASYISYNLIIRIANKPSRMIYQSSWGLFLQLKYVAQVNGSTQTSFQTICRINVKCFLIVRRRVTKNLEVRIFLLIMQTIAFSPKMPDERILVNSVPPPSHRPV